MTKEPAIDPVSAYLKAKDRCEQCKAAWTSFAKRLKTTTDWLATAASPEMFMTLEPSDQGPFRAKDWPDSKAVQSALESYLAVKSERDQLFSQLPERVQRELRRPE